MKARERFDVRGHACLGFESQVDGTYGYTSDFGVARQLGQLVIGELDATLVDERTERVCQRPSRVWRSRSAYDEIEIFLAAGLEISHFVVDAEAHHASVDMVGEKPTMRDQIEQDPPARDLGMSIATRVVLPDVSVLVGRAGIAQRSREY